MYRVSPYTYLIEAILGQAVSELPIQCSDVELVTIEPPSGLSCADYMGPFMSYAGGYLTNPNSTAACRYCAYDTTDAFLETSFNIFYSHHWRNLGIFAAFIVFNVSLARRFLWRCVQWLTGPREQVFCTYAFTFLFRVRKGSLFSGLRRKSS